MRVRLPGLGFGLGGAGHLAAGVLLALAAHGLRRRHVVVEVALIVARGGRLVRGRVRVRVSVSRVRVRVRLTLTLTLSLTLTLL